MISFDNVSINILLVNKKVIIYKGVIKEKQEDHIVANRFNILIPVVIYFGSIWFKLKSLKKSKELEDNSIIL